MTITMEDLELGAETHVLNEGEAAVDDEMRSEGGGTIEPMVSLSLLKCLNLTTLPPHVRSSPHHPYHLHLHLHLHLQLGH